MKHRLTKAIKAGALWGLACLLLGSGVYAFEQVLTYVGSQTAHPVATGFIVFALLLLIVVGLAALISDD